MKILKYMIGLIVAVLLFLLCTAFLTSNGQVVLVDPLVVPPFDARVGIVLLAAFILGGLLGLLTAVFPMIKLKAEKSRLQRRLQNTSQLISGYPK